MEKPLQRAFADILRELEKSNPVAASIARIRNRYPIPPTGLQDLAIQSQISFIRELSTDFYAGNPEEQAVCEQEIGVYSYARDTLHVKTLGAFWKRLEKRKADPKTVKIWIDQQLATRMAGLEDAIAKGYPEYTNDLERASNAFARRHIPKGQI